MEEAHQHAHRTDAVDRQHARTRGAERDRETIIRRDPRDDREDRQGREANQAAAPPLFAAEDVVIFRLLIDCRRSPLLQGRALM
jgi:hypothetical protein